MARYSRPDNTDINAIYQRLLHGEPDAPSDLIELLLEPLTAALRQRFPNTSDSAWVEQVVIDSLFKFVQEPSMFDPTRAGLWNYLNMDADGDLRNLLAKERRQRDWQTPLDAVALSLSDGNKSVEDLVLDRLASDGLAEGQSIEAVREALRNDIPDPKDWDVINLWMSGERQTELFARVLEITHLPIEEQRAQVKRTKDRLRVRLKRLGLTL